MNTLENKISKLRPSESAMFRTITTPGVLPYNSRLRLAYLPEVSVEAIQILAQDSSKTVRRAVANRENLPIQVIKMLSGDTDVLVRERLAFNKNTPDSILKGLKKDSNQWVAKTARISLQIKNKKTN